MLLAETDWYRVAESIGGHAVTIVFTLVGLGYAYLKLRNRQLDMAEKVGQHLTKQDEAIKKVDEKMDATVTASETTVAVAKEIAGDVKVVKKLTNGQHDAIVERVNTLQAAMEAHKIDCGPHKDK